MTVKGEGEHVMTEVKEEEELMVTEVKEEEDHEIAEVNEEEVDTHINQLFSINTRHAGHRAQGQLGGHLRGARA